MATLKMIISGALTDHRHSGRRQEIARFRVAGDWTRMRALAQDTRPRFQVRPWPLSCCRTEPRPCPQAVLKCCLVVRVLVDAEGKVKKAESFARILFGLYGKRYGGENVPFLQ